MSAGSDTPSERPKPIGPGNHERAWNDPPLFSVEANTRTSLPRGTRFNQRVAFPLNAPPTTPATNFNGNSSSALPPPPPPQVPASVMPPQPPSLTPPSLPPNNNNAFFQPLQPMIAPLEANQHATFTSPETYAPL